VQHLVAPPVCVNQSDETALHVCALNGFTDCAVRLLDITVFTRLDVNKKNKVSLTYSRVSCSSKMGGGNP